VKVVFEVAETITVRTVREYTFDTFEESFLTIGKENESVRFLKQVRCMLFDNFMHDLEKPEPVCIIFSIDNGMSDRE